MINKSFGNIIQYVLFVFYIFYFTNFTLEALAMNIKNTDSSNTNRHIIDSYDYLSNAASAQDCTGLIPSAPLSKSELESYEEIYKFQAPETLDKSNTK